MSHSGQAPPSPPSSDMEYPSNRISNGAAPSFPQRSRQHAPSPQVSTTLETTLEQSQQKINRFTTSNAKPVVVASGCGGLIPGGAPTNINPLNRTASSGVDTQHTQRPGSVHGEAMGSARMDLAAKRALCNVALDSPRAVDAAEATPRDQVSETARVNQEELRRYKHLYQSTMDELTCVRREMDMKDKKYQNIRQAYKDTHGDLTNARTELADAREELAVTRREFDEQEKRFVTVRKDTCADAASRIKKAMTDADDVVRQKDQQIENLQLERENQRAHLQKLESALNDCLARLEAKSGAMTAIKKEHDDEVSALRADMNQARELSREATHHRELSEKEIDDLRLQVHFLRQEAAENAAATDILKKDNKRLSEVESRVTALVGKNEVLGRRTVEVDQLLVAAQNTSQELRRKLKTYESIVADQNKSQNLLAFRVKWLTEDAEKAKQQAATEIDSEKRAAAAKSKQEYEKHERAVGQLSAHHEKEIARLEKEKMMNQKLYERTKDSYERTIEKLQGTHKDLHVQCCQQKMEISILEEIVAEMKKERDLEGFEEVKEKDAQGEDAGVFGQPSQEAATLKAPGLVEKLGSWAGWASPSRSSPKKYLEYNGADGVNAMEVIDSDAE